MATQDRLVTAITTLAKMSAHFDITDERMTASAPHGLRSATVPAADVAAP
jgi:UDP-N-acetylglucosamine 1-carboxyvinyltransferase